jgi:thymidine kinase
MNDGYLELIFGPMFSGKTTTLISKYKQHNLLDHHICVINYKEDTRYSETQLCTHDGSKIDCIQCYELTEIWENPDHYIHGCNIILINEGQFFKDIYETVLDMVEVHKKTVYICGLDSDFKRQKFGNMMDLIPYCDNIVKLQSLCMRCKNGMKALFSMRITRSESQIVIGHDNYIPVCRNCYLTA